MIEVRFLHALEALAPLRGALEALNAASTRRCAFASPALLEAFIEHDAVFTGPAAAQPWIAVAFEDGQPVGYLALRRSVERVAGLAAPLLEPLITVETDRPHPVARPEDQARVTAALWQALRALPRRTWTLLEFPLQDADAELEPPPAGLRTPRFLVRRLPSRPVSVIPLAWPNLQAYAAALSSNQRTHARKRLRALLALGPVSYQASGASDPAPLLDVYLDLEQRSWKARDDGSAAIHRNPGRVAYYRALLDDRSPLRLSFEFLLLGQRVVAGQILGTYGNRLYHLHTTFDAACAEASPATTLMLLTVRRALAGGHDALNLLPDFAYYKRRWLAEVTETRRLQVFRIWSAHGLKALLGSARRALRRAGPGHSLDHNPSRRSAEAASPALLAPASTLDQGELPPDPRLVEAARAPGAELLGPAELAQVFSFWSRGG